MKICLDICLQALSVPKTVSFEEQIMSKDKYPSIFSKSSGGYCINNPSNIFRNTGSFENWGIFSKIFPSFSWGIVHNLRV